MAIFQPYFMKGSPKGKKRSIMYFRIRLLFYSAARSRMFLLEFPQNLIGALSFQFFIKKKKRPWKKFRDASVVHVAGHWGAVTLSKYIFADDRYYDSALICHEYGHRIQSRLLGPLYLPAVGIPSLVWALMFKGYRTRRRKDYFGFYTEAWANRLSNKDHG